MADAGFHRGAPILKGAPTYYLINFPRKLHENEEFLAQMGARVPRGPLDQPLLTLPVQLRWGNIPQKPIVAKNDKQTDRQTDKLTKLPNLKNVIKNAHHLNS